MEIIGKGCPPGDYVQEGTCHSCKTRVRFRRSEGRVTHDQRDGDFVTVSCPICGGDIHSNLRSGRPGEESPR